MKSFKTISKQIYTYLNKAICVKSTPARIKDISATLRAYVNGLDGLNRNERYLIYQSSMRVARAAVSAYRLDRSPSSVLGVSENLRGLVVDVRKALASAKLRSKKLVIRAALKDDNQIFFLCSSHTSPAVGHAPYQGKIFVDRFWRQKVKGSLYYAVMSYIKNHHTLSVQDAMKGPIWLCTRPYCKHYFIPLQTTSVLHTSARKLAEEVGKVRDVEYTYTEYEKLRSQVFSKLIQDKPCDDYMRWI